MQRLGQFEQGQRSLQKHTASLENGSPSSTSFLSSVIETSISRKIFKRGRPCECSLSVDKMLSFLSVVE